MTVSPQQLKLPNHVPSTGLRGQTKLLEPRPLFLQGCPSPLAPYRSKIYTCTHLLLSNFFEMYSALHILSL